MLVIWILLLIVIFVIGFVIGEFMAYTWHRFVSHSNIPAISTSHKTHHNASFDDTATEDFVHVAIILVVAVAIFILAYTILNVRCDWLVVPLVLASVSVFVVNWWVHACIHDTRYTGSYISDLRIIHKVHHANPRANYSVLHLMDEVMCTASST